MPLSKEDNELLNSLCARIQNERDPRKFTVLVEELNTLLERAYSQIALKRTRTA